MSKKSTFSEKSTKKFLWSWEARHVLNARFFWQWSAIRAHSTFFCLLFGKSVFLGHLDQYLSLPKIQKYGIVIIEKNSYDISSRSCQKWQFSSSYDSWVWKSGFFRMWVSSWSPAGSLGTPIMSVGAVVGSQSAPSSFRELLHKRPSYLRRKCFWWLSLN